MQNLFGVILILIVAMRCSNPTDLTTNYRPAELEIFLNKLTKKECVCVCVGCSLQCLVTFGLKFHRSRQQNSNPCHNEEAVENNELKLSLISLCECGRCPPGFCQCRMADCHYLCTLRCLTPSTSGGGGRGGGEGERGEGRGRGSGV